jgi:hypothetical protein
MSMQVNVRKFVAGLVACALSGSSFSGQQRDPIVSAIDAQVTTAPVVVNVGGREHLVYELHVTSFSRSDVTLTRVEVVDASGGRTIAALSGAALADRIGRPGAPASRADKRVIAPGMRAIVFMWLPLEKGSSSASEAVRHRMAIDVAREGQPTSMVVAGAEANVRRERPIVLGPPLRGGPFVAIYDPLLVGGHRTAIYAVNGRARIPARFAIDFVRLHDDGTHARDDRSVVANWHGYGAEVLAVADATVVQARDDISEAPSIGGGQGPIALENASGNDVSLDLGGGHFAFYEHLKHGSVRVKRGDRVKAGDVIGLLGNSGSSSAGPHLHFHVADASADLAGEGLPYVFASFETVGAFDDITASTQGVRWKSPPADLAGARRGELPAPLTVIVFPATPRQP